MGRYCYKCGEELKEHAIICMSCGYIVNPYDDWQSMETPQNLNNNGKSLATVSVVFGSLSFLVPIICSIIGIVTAVKGIKNPENKYKNRCRIGFCLSVGIMVFQLILVASAILS